MDTPVSKQERPLRPVLALCQRASEMSKRSSWFYLAAARLEAATQIAEIFIAGLGTNFRSHDAFFIQKRLPNRVELAPPSDLGRNQIH